MNQSPHRPPRMLTQKEKLKACGQKKQRCPRSTSWVWLNLPDLPGRHLWGNANCIWGDVNSLPFSLVTVTGWQGDYFQPGKLSSCCGWWTGAIFHPQLATVQSLEQHSQWTESVWNVTWVGHAEAWLPEAQPSHEMAGSSCPEKRIPWGLG